MRFSLLFLSFSVFLFTLLVSQDSSTAQDTRTSELLCSQDEYEINRQLRDTRQDLHYTEAELGDTDGYIGLHYEAGQITNGINRLEEKLEELDASFFARRDQTLSELREIRVKIDNANAAFRMGLSGRNRPSGIARIPSLFLDGAGLALALYELLEEIDALESEHNAASRDLYEARDEVRAELEEFQTARIALETRRDALEVEKNRSLITISALENCLLGNNPSFREIPEPQQYAGQYFSRQDDLLPASPASEEELNLFLNNTFLVEPYDGYSLTGLIEVNLQQGRAAVENEGRRLVFSSPVADLNEERGRYCLSTADINQDGTPDIFGTLVMSDGGKYFPHYLAVMVSSGSEENNYRTVTIGFDDIAANSLDHIPSLTRGVLFNTIIQCITINSGGNGVNFNIDMVPHHIVTYTIDENRARQQRIFYELR